MFKNKEVLVAGFRFDGVKCDFAPIKFRCIVINDERGKTF